MDVPWLQLAVYAQPMVWIALYNRKTLVSLNTFYVLGLAAAGFVLYTGLSSGFYTSELIIFYILAVLFTAHHYRDRGGFKPICLAFLIVFVNSFFWEAPIHVADLLEGNFGVVVIQSLHLLPLIFLLTLGFRVPGRWWYWSVAMWAAVAGVEFIRLNFHPPSFISIPLLYFCRALGLYTLLWVLQFPGYGDKLIFRLKDRLSEALGWVSAGTAN